VTQGTAGKRTKTSQAASTPAHFSETKKWGYGCWCCCH
jgi:hypothetical protein